MFKEGRSGALHERSRKMSDQMVEEIESPAEPRFNYINDILVSSHASSQAPKCESLGQSFELASRLVSLFSTRL